MESISTAFPLLVHPGGINETRCLLSELIKRTALFIFIPSDYAPVKGANKTIFWVGELYLAKYSSSKVAILPTLVVPLR